MGSSAGNLYSASGKGRGKIRFGAKDGIELLGIGRAVSDFNGLVIFAAVAEAKSFSEAARRLKMPLASVSRRVADLEHELGVKLLERSTRNLRLTEVGTEVLEYA